MSTVLGVRVQRRSSPELLTSAQPPPTPEARGGLKHHTVISCAWHLPWVPGGAGQRSGSWTRRFTPPNIEARPSASRARCRSYTRGSEVGLGDRCRPSLKP